MNTIAKLNAEADAEAKARTPSAVFPHNGGLDNPKFKFRRGCDIARTKYAAVVGTQISKTKVVALVDRVLPVQMFGGK